MERTYRITPQRDGRWQCKAEDVDLPLVFCDSSEEAEELFSAMSEGLGRTRLKVFDKTGLLLRDRTFAPAQGTD